MRKLIIKGLLLVLGGWSLVVGGACFAQSAQSADLAKQKETYLKEYKYSEFVEYLKGQKDASPAEADYYIALTRYEQLKYLEATQNWDEYFSKGNDYRDEMTNKAQEAISLTLPKDKINTLSRCVLWQLHKDQQDVLEAQALEDLVNAAKGYSNDPACDIAVIKYVADKLASYEERVRFRELYDTYVKKLITPETKEETLQQVADEIYQQGNTALSALVYDAYIERIAQSQAPDKLIASLFSVAKLFVYKDKGVSDPAYAEKIFQKIESMGGLEAFDEGLMYLRAWNLEKSHTFTEAKFIYTTMVEKYPQSSRRDEAIYKNGIISVYVLRDMSAGIGYFEQLANSQIVTPQVISSLYQLGLLAQWKKDFEKAKGYYSKLFELAGDDYPETAVLAKDRVRELDGSGEIEYNLRTFLDVSLSDEYASYDMSKVEIKSSPYKILKDEKAEISASTYMPESGCMSVEVSYLWSGHLGNANPSASQSGFATSYLHPGTKEINVVVVSPSGILDRRVDMVDDYSQ